MRKFNVFSLLLSIFFIGGQLLSANPSKNLTERYDVLDDNLDRAAWFREARFGMFIHWGLYSVLGGSYGGRTMPDKSLSNGNSWYAEWVQMRLEVPKEDYQSLVKEFNPLNFDADEWAREASLAGMKYMVITSKHHDGFALWGSEVSNYDMGATPFKRDLLGELAEACRKYGLKFGFYYSHWQDWEHLGGALPPWENKVQPSDKEFERYWQEKSLPQVRELLERYNPDLLWFDTWNKTSEESSDICPTQITLKRRDELIDLIRSIKPDCLINGRICAYNPGSRVDYISAGDNEHPEKNLGRPWQTPATMNHTWAWHANDFNWKSADQMIKLLVNNASVGGNYLLNIGPHADGRIPSPSLRRLREVGAWLVANGESIYGAYPLDDVERPDWGVLTGRTTNNQTIVYAHVMDWGEGILQLPSELGKAVSAKVLETGENVQLVENGRAFVKPSGAVDTNVSTIKILY